MLLFLVSLFTLSHYHWVPFHHPKPEILYRELSENLREDSRVNFITLQTIRYEYKNIKENLHNNTIFVKNTLHEKKMTNRRKIDYLFARHTHMINKIHKRSQNNLHILENNRRKVSDHLSDLKRDHLLMVDRLTKNNEDIKEMYEDKKEKILDKLTDKYSEWKNKREEILDIINI